MRGERARAIGRLTKRPEFLAAAAGRRFHTERLTLQGRLRAPADDGWPGLRFGFTVTKKVGHATERNRIKRRLRAAANDAGAAHAGTPADVVVIGRRDALSAAYDVLVDDIDRGLRAVTKPKGPRTRPAPSLSTGDASREPPHA
jgi:ribonuclease P protein component